LISHSERSRLSTHQARYCQLGIDSYESEMDRGMWNNLWRQLSNTRYRFGLWLYEWYLWSRWMVGSDDGMDRTRGTVLT
jgi:hypothetical protein